MARGDVLLVLVLRPVGDAVGGHGVGSELLREPVDHMHALDGLRCQQQPVGELGQQRLQRVAAAVVVGLGERGGLGEPQRRRDAEEAALVLAQPAVGAGRHRVEVVGQAREPVPDRAGVVLVDEQEVQERLQLRLATGSDGGR